MKGRKSLQKMGPSLSNVDLSNDPGPPTELERVRERGREREREREREVEYITRHVYKLLSTYPLLHTSTQKPNYCKLL